MNIMRRVLCAARSSRRFVPASILVTLAACAGGAAHDTTADQAAIRAVALAWKAAFNAGDSAAVSALYAQDAVLSPPGAPLVQGRARIADYFLLKVAQFSGSGLSVEDAPLGEVSVSGDLGFQWETYRIKDQSGAVVDAGRLLTLLRREGRNWLIVGDTWNSDAAPGSRPAATSGDAEER